MTRLAELVVKYEKKDARNEDRKLSDFRKPYKSFVEHLIDAVWGYLPDRKRDKHQRRIKPEVLDEIVKILSDEAIVNALNNCKSFDEVLNVIYQSKIEGFGSLSVYDTALRLGAYYNLYPDVIYLHCGAKTGARKLLGVKGYKNNVKNYMGDKKYPYITKDCLPTELQSLDPYHIENFLCIYKHRI